MALRLQKLEPLNLKSQNTNRRFGVRNDEKQVLNTQIGIGLISIENNDHQYLGSLIGSGLSERAMMVGEETNHHLKEILSPVESTQNLNETELSMNRQNMTFDSAVNNMEQFEHIVREFKKDVLDLKQIDQMQKDHKQSVKFNKYNIVNMTLNTP